MQLENYSVLKILILEEISANHSTSEISKSLGFKFDKFGRWINNLKILKWDEFTIICNQMGLNLSHALEIVKYQTSEDQSPESIFGHLKKYNAFSSNQEAADYLKYNISVVKRYSSGSTLPDIETIFKLLDYKNNILSLFLSRLFNDQFNNPILKSWIDSGAKPTYLEANLPISSMIEAALFLESYKTKDLTTVEWLSNYLHFKLEIIEEALAKMLQSEMLTISKENADIYIPSQTTTNLDGLEVQEIIPFIQFLNLRLVDMLEKRKAIDFKSSTAPGAMVYRVFPTSTEAINKINTILFQAHAEILKTIEEDTNPKTEARVLLLQTFSLT